MSKAVLEAVEQLVKVSLTEGEKRVLAHRLNQVMWGKRLDALFERIDQRQKRLPRISMQEIVQEVKAVRRNRASARYH